MRYCFGVAKSLAHTSLVGLTDALGQFQVCAFHLVTSIEPIVLAVIL